MFDWWFRSVLVPEKMPLIWCLGAFLLTFLATRIVTRLIRHGRGPFHNAHLSGVRIHHSVPGILLLVAGALLALVAVDPPFPRIAGMLVGTGMSLVLDEFGNILHLDDVYWQREGQASVQAVGLTTVCLLAAIVGLNPLGVDQVDSTERTTRMALIVFVAVSAIAVLVCAAKGKYRLALLAIFIPLIAVVGAARLARPGSPWANRRYAAGSPKAVRAARRAAAFDARLDPVWRRLADAVAGAPED
ncbi:MAG: hypothetical protein ABI131_01740 [Nostocoides sp.]